MLPSTYTIESIIGNLRRRYGNIAPPIGHIPPEEHKYWEEKGLDYFDRMSWDDMYDGPGEESQEATEKVAWIYFLILKRQNYGLSPIEEKFLRKLIADFLKDIRQAIYMWLVIHGRIDDFETFKEIMFRSASIYSEEWSEDIEEKRRELEEEYGEEVYYWTDEEIIEELIEERWELLRQLGVGAVLGPGAIGLGSVIESAEQLMNRIDTILQVYDTCPLSDLIILFDAAVDFEHQNGKLLEEAVYFFVDVLLAKKLAEIKFNEYANMLAYAKFVGSVQK